MTLRKKSFAIAFTIVSVIVTNPTLEAAAQGYRHAGPALDGHRSNVDPSAVREFKAAQARMMRNMMVPFTGDPDVDFRTHMIPHHQGAIDMARVAKRHAKNPLTRQVGEAIDVSQQREIYEFRGWLARSEAMAPNRVGADPSAVREYKAVHARMMRKMKMPFTGDPDVDFRMHMISHHQAAIDMAKVALRHAKDAWTRQNAEAVIVEQQYEIHQFRSWLARRGVKAPPGGDPLYLLTARSFPPRNHDEDPGLGTQAELAGQTWAPGSGVPNQLY